MILSKDKLRAGHVDSARTLFGLFYIESHGITGLKIGEHDALQSAFMKENVLGAIFWGNETEVFIGNHAFDSTFHID